MKLIVNLFILIALVLLVVAVISKFFNTVILFPDVELSTHLILANTFLLLALIMKLVKD